MSGDTPTGDGSADSRDPLVAQVDALYGDEISKRERLVEAAEATLEVRIATLRQQHGEWALSVAKEISELRSAREGLRGREALHGQDSEAAEALKA